MTVAIEPIAARRSLVWIVWPAFFSACLLEALVFSMVDPQSLHWFGQPVALSGQAVYSLAFFTFWLIAMVATGLTVLLATPSRRWLNRPTSDLSSEAPPRR